MIDLSRRRFLKISAATLAASGWGRTAERAADATASGTREVPTFCSICFWKCGAIAHVREGKLWKIVGNPADPLSRGRLCPRGTGGIGAHYDPDRLRAPLIRTKERGQEAWKSVTWEEALDYIARRLKKLKADHGPESLALFSHGAGGKFFKTLVKAYGTPNISAPSFAQCRGPREVGFELTFGEGVGSPERTDIAHADCLVLIGSHLGENMHNTQVQEFAQAVKRGATVIVVDPRFSVAASKAKYWLPIKPGTDLALLLAWMHVLINEKRYDEEYVRKHGFGFEQLKAWVQQYTPEWAYPETGIDPETIRATAREMGRYRPATLLHPGRHVTWYGDDTQRSRAMAILCALLGSWGRKGGFYVPAAPEVPAYPLPDFPKPQRPALDNPEQKHPFASESITTGIREATLSGKPYPIKGWMVYGTNLIDALPNIDETVKAIQQLDFLVVVDVIPSEITGWADVVLPEANYLERHDDLHVGYFREPFIGIRQPVVPPPHDQKPGWWIAKQLGHRLGLDAYFPWKDLEEYLAKRCELAGVDFAALKRRGILPGAREPVYFADGAPEEYLTPSGKVEFYSPQLKEKGFDPLPKYVRPPAGPPGSFRLLFGRAPVHSFSRTQTNPILADLMAENCVWINATVARRYGLKSGDRVRLKNQDGVVSLPVRVKATERIRPDCVYLVHGFGHTAKGLKRAYHKGASDARLITRYQTDPLMGGTGMNVNFVTLELEA